MGNKEGHEEKDKEKEKEKEKLKAEKRGVTISNKQKRKSMNVPSNDKNETVDVVTLAHTEIVKMASDYAVVKVAETQRVFYLHYPKNWRAEPICNVYANHANAIVIQWLVDGGIIDKDVKSVSNLSGRNIVPGEFAGYPFPTAGCDRLTDVAKLWTIQLLWDDTEVESVKHDESLVKDFYSLKIEKDLENKFLPLIKQVLHSMKKHQGDDFVDRHAQEMFLWYTHARKESKMAEAYRQDKIDYDFKSFFENRKRTVGAHAGVVQVEFCEGYLLSKAFHENAIIKHLKELVAEMCAVTNDLASLANDLESKWPSIITILMKVEHYSITKAIQKAIEIHDSAVKNFDDLAPQAENLDPLAHIYVQQLRQYVSGLSLWHNKAPRYHVRETVINGEQVIFRAQFN